MNSTAALPDPADEQVRRTLDAFLRVHYLPDVPAANTRATRGSRSRMHGHFLEALSSVYEVEDFTDYDPGENGQGFDIRQGYEHATLDVSCVLPCAVLFGQRAPGDRGPVIAVGDPGIWYQSAECGNWLDPAVRIVQASGFLLLSAAVARADPGFRVHPPDYPESYYEVLFNSNVDTP